MSQPSQLLLGISAPQAGQRTLFPDSDGERAHVIDGGKISKQVWRQTSGVSEGKSNLVSDPNKAGMNRADNSVGSVCLHKEKKKNSICIIFNLPIQQQLQRIVGGQASLGQGAE